MALLHIENNGIATVSLNRPDKRNATEFCFTP
jgi:enoyl-CoA hydratase/carnithine racemase